MGPVPPRPRECWAIYDHPSNFPDHWVVQRWVGGVPDAVGKGYLTLDAARAGLPEGLTYLGCEPGDDPVIAEVWATERTEQMSDARTRLVEALIDFRQLRVGWRTSAGDIITALDAFLDERERNAAVRLELLEEICGVCHHTVGECDAKGDKGAAEVCGGYAARHGSVAHQVLAAALTEDPWHEARHEGPGGKAIRCTTAICVHPNHRRPPATDAEVRGHARPSPATVPIDITATVVTCSCETKWEDSKGIPERVIARQVSGCRLHGVCAAGHTVAAAGPPYVRCGVCGWQEARHGGSVYCQVHSCGDPAHYPSGGRPFVLCTCPSTRPISAGHEAACPCHPTTPHGEWEKKPHDAQPDEGSTARAKTPREVWVILNADGAPQEVYPTEAKARHEAEDWYGQGEHAPIERYMVAPVDVPAGPQRLAAAKTRLDELHAEMTAVLLSIGTTESA